jgi:hypothetical protein
MDSEVGTGAEGDETAQFGPGSTVRRDPSVLAKRVDDEIVLVHLETNRIYELNPTGAFLWDSLGAGSTPAELEELLALEFDVDPDELAREVDELLRHLASERLILTQ